MTPSLASAADTAIKQVLLTGATSVGQKKPTGEVGFVAAFVLDGVTEIAKAWKPLLRPHGLSVKMSGVFCHQTPRVTFSYKRGAKKSCELADLLVVVDDLTSEEPTRRWAVLIQAKMSKVGGGQTLSSAGDLVQLDLLTNWPSFTLPLGFQQTPRDFSTCSYAGAAVDCGRYGLIHPQPSPDWRQQAPASSMPTGGAELGTFLARMAEGRVGYGREATGRGDDWSLTVDELLTVTGALAFKYSAGLAGTHPRLNNKVALVITPADGASPQPWTWGRWAAERPPSGGRPDVPPDGPGGQGISFVHIGITRYSGEA
ncbi:hypothetical protein [Phenylobacterium sp. RIFCSPHIGHO2_01_FULL_69_31]|uniref:hypothetical protein n=1 Tax=Phenylobacterium sp. RIFCSPHIGHO2_01_FULL_69_31 TaxID=1801944 RepID=UPI0025D26209|nr:hypothetical protein [Phenylobacterium sp. RIFCSPHIGHO2_01_FULL_69_31]